jgi:hypothetical protein
MYPGSGNITSQVNSLVLANVDDVCGVDSAAGLASTDTAMAVEIAHESDGGLLLGKVQLQDDFAARRCSSAYLGSAAAAAPAGEWS